MWGMDNPPLAVRVVVISPFGPRNDWSYGPTSVSTSSFYLIHRKDTEPLKS